MIFGRDVALLAWEHVRARIEEMPPEEQEPAWTTVAYALAAVQISCRASPR